MSKAVDVSKLGEYVLTGWVLTDCPCPAPSCKGAPLLRSPESQQPIIHLCANCGVSLKAQSSEGTESSSSTVSSTSHGSRPSTPPTELSSSLSSPTFAPPVETEDMIRRRQQSDQASTEIGKRLLKGWTMLAEECPNTRCYGVPLVRPPKTGVDKDPRKECVICGTTYIIEDSEGWQRLVPMSTGVSSPEHRFTRSSQQSGPDKDRAISRNSPQPIQLPTLDPPLGTPKLIMDLPSHAGSELRGIQFVAAVPPSTVSLDASAQALERALGALSERLVVMSTNPSLLDPPSVAVTAEAISKVAHALGQVKQLQRQGGTLSSLIS